MAVVVVAVVRECLKKLEQLVTEEAVRILGVKDDLRRLQEKLKKINAVLADAERMRIQDSTVSLWLSDLNDVMYDADDIIDLCRIKGRELLPGGGGEGETRSSTSSSSSSSVRRRRFHLFSSCFTSVSSVPLRHEIGASIQKLNQRLEEISKDRLMFSLQPTSGPNVNIGTQIVSSRPPPTSDLSTLGLIGRQANFAAERLVDSLVKAQEEDTKSLLVFAIVGLGGIGKTTLAQKIYNHQKVQAHFQKRLWVCVSESYSEKELLKQMVRSAGGDCGRAQSKGELQHLLISALEGQRFLVVLDDVWQAGVWEESLEAPLLRGRVAGSRVLVTSRKEDVARSMRAIHTHRVDKLPSDEGWELLCKCVFGDGDDEDIPRLHEIGMKIVDRCDGLPLAIKAIAGVLRTKDRRTSEWEKVHKSQAWSVTGELPEAVRGALYLSYEDLPSQLKQCFLYCSLFPEDYTFYRQNFIRMWVAEGFIPAQGDTLLEDLAEDCYNSLINRSLLHLSNITINGDLCTMHDLTRSLVMFQTRDESCFLYGNESTFTSSLKLRRLALYNREETEDVLNTIENPQCLRTLHMHDCVQINTEDIFQRFRHLRVMNLSSSKIENIPESILSLQHLRHLNLMNTRVRELPESIGCLTNLQFLNLFGCKSLRTLPKAITRLCNLRCLDLVETAISHVPSGIGKLHHLSDLQGFVVGEDNDDDHENRQSQYGCGLDELQSMSQLRILAISRLEKALTGGIQPLKDKPYLKKLTLEWSENVDQSLISVRTQQICEELSPSSSLEELKIIFFPGLMFPQWISMLPNLIHLKIKDCISCEQLPPLGQLPQLRILFIQGASAVVTIGPEFLCCNRQDGLGHSGASAASAAFPKLEFLLLISMPNLEEWKCDAEEAGDRRIATIKLLPRLQQLQIAHCPKLRALPEGLRHADALKTCYIHEADSLREIKNLHSLEELNVHDSPCLERISNLPALRELRISGSCRMLKFVENLNSLQTFTLHMTDDSIECLPEWLLGLLQQQSTSGVLQTFMFYCTGVLARKCSEGGQYWTLLQGIPHFALFIKV